MILDGVRQAFGLNREAGQSFGGEGVPGQLPFDPVDDAERQWIRFPTIAGARRVFFDPALDQIALRRIEVMEIVQPELGKTRIVPAAEFWFLIQKAEAERAGSRGLPVNRL